MTRSPGLGLRIQGGKRTWVCRYRVRGAGKQRQVTLGAVAALRLKDAREAAGEYISGARKGTDVAAAEREAAEKARREAEAAGTRRLGAVVTRYKVHAAKTLRPSTVREIGRYLDRHWQPLHGHIADELDRRTIVARLEGIAEANGPIAANRAKAYLSACLAWGVERGLLSQNPCIGVPEHRAGEPARSRAERRGDPHALACPARGRLRRHREATAPARPAPRRGRRHEVAGAGLRAGRVAHSGRALEEPQAAYRAAARAQRSRSSRSRDRKPDRSHFIFGVGRKGFSGFGACKARMDMAIAVARARTPVSEPGREGADEARAAGLDAARPASHGGDRPAEPWHSA